jgi:tRNA pseudouridine38-40 synthase
LAADRWIKALNALLPSAIRVLRCRYVSQDFHARLSAKGKVYRYRIWTAPILPPFEYGRAWHIAQPLDLKILKSAAKHFLGTHDFATFAANRGKPEPSTIRTINSLRVSQKGPCIMIEFDGNGFLYKMVRLIVGALVKCALGKMRIEEVTARLNSGQVGSARFAAPAKGLSLVRVRY